MARIIKIEAEPEWIMLKVERKDGSFYCIDLSPQDDNTGAEYLVLNFSHLNKKVIEASKTAANHVVIGMMPPKKDSP